MPIYLQGDIFTTALDGDYDLAVVFGQLGLNEMAQTWRNAQRQVPEWNNIEDPFTDRANEPTEITPRKWFWFIHPEQNHGIDDNRLNVIFNHIFEWAQEKKLKRVITNGVSNIDKGMSTDANRASDDARVRLISSIMMNYENKGFQVTLISLNDAYTRNFAQA
jgi:hypothetical protein